MFERCNAAGVLKKKKKKNNEDNETPANDYYADCGLSIINCVSFLSCVN